MSVVASEDLDGGVRLLTLDRPPANAIDNSLLSGLEAAVEAAAQAEDVRAVVLTGSGTFFSGGFDFGAEDTASVGLYNSSHRSLLSIPKPTVAAVNGHAVAGGLVLALACDHVVALDGDYRTGLTEVSVGAGFPRAAVEIVKLKLTYAAVAELALGAALLHASDLVRLGVVGELVADPRSVAIELATRLATHSAASYAHTKASLISSAVAGIDAETDEERQRGAAVWAHPESRTARKRMRERLFGS